MRTKVLGTLFILFLLYFLSACNPPYGPKTTSSCKNCHTIKIDKAHQLDCTECHRGNSSKNSKASAHEGLVRYPASIKNANFFCEPCHEKETKSALKSTHYTLKNEIQKIWTAFFPKSNPPNLTEIKGINQPETKEELLMDLLARRCLRCHVYYKGDTYKGTHRGIGCTPCHMNFDRKVSHIFQKPTTKNCLSCHYGNFVGWDFVGRFEKDYPEDFRAPLEKGEHLKRPYGVEWIDMSADVHFQRGLTCIDCHLREEFHPLGTGAKVIDCLGCHQLISNRFGHKKINFNIMCNSCHAKWGFYDFGQDLLRIDDPDVEDWAFLKVQGSSEIERQKVYMADKIHGLDYKGIWLKGYKKRRWWPVILGISKDKNISVLRPILDISLSYLDQDEEILFEKLSPTKLQDFVPLIINNSYLKFNKNTIWLPYSPHTIGKADIFRSNFLEKMFNKERGNTEMKR